MGVTRKVIDAAVNRHATSYAFFISDKEYEKVRELMRRYYGSRKNEVSMRSMIRKIVKVVINNITVDLPIIVYKRTYDLYTAPQGDWYKVLIDRVLRDHIMSLSITAYAGLSKLYPRAFKKLEFMFDPRLGVDFALVAFEYFLDTNWKDAVYATKPR